MGDLIDMVEVYPLKKIHLVDEIAAHGLCICEFGSISLIMQIINEKDSEMMTGGIMRALRGTQITNLGRTLIPNPDR